MHTLRPLELRDAPRLEDFLYLAIHVPPGAPAFDRVILQDPLMACYIKDWGQPQDFGIVAETTPGELVGAAWIRQLTPDCPGYGYIDEVTPSLAISVLPSLQGQGIGSDLLTQLLQQAPCDRIGLSVQNSNPAKRLYQRMGFVILQETIEESVMLWTSA